MGILGQRWCGLLSSRFLFRGLLLPTVLVLAQSALAESFTRGEGSDQATEAVGKYLLVSANSQRLPAVVSESSTSRQEVTGGSVLLEEDGSYTWRTSYLNTEGDVVAESSESSARGDYLQQGASVILLLGAGDGRLEGTLNGDTLTIQADVPMVYRRVVGQGPAETLTAPIKRGGMPPPPARPSRDITFTLSLAPGYLPSSLKELCESSLLIAEARVQSILPPRQNVRYPPSVQLLQERTFPIFRYLETDVILTVSRVLKGAEAIRQVAISQKGGVLGPYTELPIQYSLMRPGEHYILFLTGETQPDLPEVTGARRYALNGSWTGMFRIDESGVHVSPDAADVIRERFEGRSSQDVITEIQRSCRF